MWLLGVLTMVEAVVNNKHSTVIVEDKRKTKWQINEKERRNIPEQISKGSRLSNII